MNSRYKRTVIMILAVVYMLSGAVLYWKGSAYVSSVSSSGESISVTAQGISQKVTGNDYAMNKITFQVASCDLGAGDLVDIYLCEGSNDLERADILQHDVLPGEEISEAVVLHYPQYKTIYDRDYYIVFKLREDGAGRLLLQGSKHAAGVYTGDTEYGLSCVYEIKYFTHDTMGLFYWKIITVFIVLSAAVMLYSQSGFWRALEISTMFIAFFLYVLGLLDLIQYAEVILGAITVAALAALPVMLWKKRPALENRVQEIKASNYKYDILFWLILLVLFLLHDKGLHVEHQDEYTHWATAVKNMYLFDRMPIHAGSTVMLYRYPPVYTLFQYLFLKMYGGYSAGILYFSKHFLEASLMLGVFDTIRLKDRKWSFYGFAVIMVLGLPDLLVRGELLDNYNFYNTLYVDITLGIVLGAFLVELWKYNDEDSSIRQGVLVFISGFLLIMIKDNGMILFVTAMSAFVLVSCLTRALDKKRLSGILWGAAGFITARVSWEYFVKTRIELMESAKLQSVSGSLAIAGAVSDQAGTIAAAGLATDQFDTLGVTGLSAQTIVNFLTGKGAAYQYEIIPGHIMHLLFGGRFETKILNFSFAIWLAVFLLIFKAGKLSKKNAWFTLLAAMICAAIYHVVYTFTLSEREALVFASEERYLGSFLLGIGIWCIYLLGKNITDHAERIKLLQICVIAVLVLTDFCGSYRSRVTDKAYEKKKSEFQIATAQELRKYLREGDRLYYISCGDLEENYWINRYYLTPVHLNLEREYAPRIDSTETYEYAVTEEELEEQLKSYDYLYLNRIDRQFCQDYGALFDNAEDIEEKELYKIVQESGKLRLLPVNNFYYVIKGLE